MSKMFEFVKSGYLHDLLWKYDTKPVITENGTDIDVSGLDKIDVNVPNPSTGKVNITSTAEVNVTNYAVAQVVDANLVAGNIKKDVSILGVTGSFEGGGGDSVKTVNVNVQTSHLAFAGRTLIYNDEIIEQQQFFPNTTYNLVVYKTSGDNYAADMALVTGLAVSFSNEVNCSAEYFDDDRIIVISIIDINTPASITISFTDI